MLCTVSQNHLHKSSMCLEGMTGLLKRSMTVIQRNVCTLVSLCHFSSVNYFMDEYCNCYVYYLTISLFLAPMRNSIPVSEFCDYVLEMTQEDERNISHLAREFSVTCDCVRLMRDPCHSGMQRIPSSPASSYSVACLPHNIGSNRFRNIYPCKTIKQHTLVIECLDYR